MTTKPTYELILARDYPERLMADITTATESIVLTTMIFRNDCPTVMALMETLIKAAQRGVRVSMCADNMTYLEPLERFFAIHKRISRARDTSRLDARMREAGIEFHWLGRTKIGFLGRLHSKWTVIDDTVYSFGGVNIDAKSFSNTDFMIRLRDKNLAHELNREHHKLIRVDKRGHSLPDRTIQFKNDTVLIDGGLKARSSIYHRAQQLAAQATTITFVSQYCPTGKLASLLSKIGSAVYFNTLEQTSYLNTMVVRIGMLRSHLVTQYRRDSYLHAKFIIFTMPDGSKRAITGSHNFTTAGNAFGTREIALETSNPQLIADLERFVKQYVA